VEFADSVDDAAAFLDRTLAPGDLILLKSSHGSGLWELADRLVEADR
jgi:UDP-N-acetylmuramoyl-tripeptide--D-alanyl-D-alanine ligase